MPTFTGNRGEWSELYAFLKLLLERKLVGANELLEEIPNFCLNVVEVRRHESKRDKRYVLLEDGIVDMKEGTAPLDVLSIGLKPAVGKILEKINAGEARTFEVEGVEDVLAALNVEKLNAGNAQKEDLQIVVRDDQSPTGETKLGFSVKSRLGAAASLLNASNATNIIYEIEGCDARSLEGGPKDLLKKIALSGGTVKFHSFVDQRFKNNLELIDSALPELVAEMTKAYYMKAGTSVSELVRDGSYRVHGREEEMPKNVVEYKIKHFLQAVALGMTPTDPWDGRLQAEGGVIVIRQDGNLVCFHTRNFDKFKDYLYSNVKLDTASRKKHGFAKIYEEDGKQYIRLNLQVRFKE